MSVPSIKTGDKPYIFSTGHGVNAQVAVDTRVSEWAKNYGRDPLNYENYFLHDAKAWAANVSRERPATLAVLTVRDPRTKKGFIGSLNDSRGTTMVGDYFKKEFYSALIKEFKKAGINVAIYENKVEFKLVIEGRVDQSVIESIAKKAVDSINPKLDRHVKGLPVTDDIFGGGKNKPRVEMNWTIVDEPCSEGELKAVMDKLFEILKHDRRSGRSDFARLLHDVRTNEAFRIQSPVTGDPDWGHISRNWEKFQFAFHDCATMMPDEFRLNMCNTIENYGVAIDENTSQYLLLKNNQRFVDNATGANNKRAYLTMAGRDLEQNNFRIYYGGGDLYNVGGLNVVLGRTMTDRYMRAWFETWREVANEVGVEIEECRMGGDEYNIRFKGANAEIIARMHQSHHRTMNARPVVTAEDLPNIPEPEKARLIKNGILRKGPNGELEITGRTYGDIVRPYAKKSGVITRGSRHSFYAKRVEGELRKDPWHFDEGIGPRASKIAQKALGATTAVVRDDDGSMWVFDSSSVEEVRRFREYSVEAIAPNKRNLQDLRKLILNDQDAVLLEKRKISDTMNAEVYRLSTGAEVTIQIASFKGYIEVQASDGRLFRLTAPEGMDAHNVSAQRMFNNADDIYAYIAELKKKGYSDTQILEDAVKRMEEAGNKQYLKQVKVLKNIGKVAAPLGIAATLYMIHMINTAPAEERGKLFSGFIAGFSAGGAGLAIGTKIPGNPFVKAGGALALSVVFGIIGDVAMRKFISSHPQIKTALESVKTQKVTAFLRYMDPISFTASAINEVRVAAARRKKNEYIVSNGVEAWNAQVDSQIKPLKEQVRLLMALLSDPLSSYMRHNGISSIGSVNGNDLEAYVLDLQKEVSGLASNIERLTQQIVLLDRKIFRTEADYRHFLERVRMQSRDELKGAHMATAGVKG